MLYPGEKVYEEEPGRYRELVGDGSVVVVGGENRLLSRLPPEPGHNPREYSKVFSAEVPTIPESEWQARIEEQLRLKSRTSDFQKFDPDNQGSHPICWAAGTCHAAATARVIQGLPFVRLSAGCIATDVTGGVSSGGYEGNAVRDMAKRGVPSVDVWPYQSSRPTGDSAAVAASRAQHVALEAYELETVADYVTAALLNFPMTVAYSSWSHVVMGCDVVWVNGRAQFRIRNNWGSWGANNDAGFSGYSVMRFPDSGWAFRQMTASVQ